jgi:hypothetical protein
MKKMNEFKVDVQEKDSWNIYWNINIAMLLFNCQLGFCYYKPSNSNQVETLLSNQMIMNKTVVLWSV